MVNNDRIAVYNAPINRKAHFLPFNKYNFMEWHFRFMRNFRNPKKPPTKCLQTIGLMLCVPQSERIVNLLILIRCVEYANVSARILLSTSRISHIILSNSNDTPIMRDLCELYQQQADRR